MHTDDFFWISMTSTYFLAYCRFHICSHTASNTLTWQSQYILLMKVGSNTSGVWPLTPLLTSLMSVGLWKGKKTRYHSPHDTLPPRRDLELCRDRGEAQWRSAPLKLHMVCTMSVHFEWKRWPHTFMLEWREKVKVRIWKGFFSYLMCMRSWNKVYLKVLPSLICNDSPIQISAPLSVLTTSFLFVIMMTLIFCTLPRSTLHQGLDCVWVRVQEYRSPKFETLFPSTALPATAEPLVVDCSALSSSAKFLRGSPYKNIQISITHGNHIIYSRGKHPFTCQHSRCQHQGYAWVNNDVNLTVSLLNDMHVYF